MSEKHKLPTFEGIVIIILLVISIVSLGYYTETPTGMANITGNMVRVTGMASAIRDGENKNVGDSNWAWEELKKGTVIHKAYGSEYVEDNYRFFKGEVENYRIRETYQLIDEKIVGIV